MNVETVQIDSIQLDPANVRRHPERNLATIRGSLARFGQQKPVVVDARGIVLAGNGTLAAARELGWTEIKIVRTGLAGSEATAFAIADNRTSETSEWDQQGLAEILTALQAEDANLAGAAGYTPDELAALISGPEPEAAEAPADFPSVGEDIQTDHECPKCGYVWSGISAPKGGANG
jgi:ParB-like chromosome segregation protein Spo0J